MSANFNMISVQSVASTAHNPITQMMIDGILSGDQSMVNVAQGAIFAKAAMAQVPEYTANINRIASGLEGQGLQRNNGNDFGVA